MKLKAKTFRAALTAVALATGAGALTLGGVALAQLSGAQSSAAGRLTPAQQAAASTLSTQIAQAVANLGSNPSPAEVTAAIQNAIQAAVANGADPISVNLGLAQATAAGTPLAALVASSPQIATAVQATQTTVLANAVAQAISNLPADASATDVQAAVATQITTAGVAPAVATAALNSTAVNTVVAASANPAVSTTVAAVTTSVSSGQFTVASTGGTGTQTGTVTQTGTPAAQPPPVVVVPVYVG